MAVELPAIGAEVPQVAPLPAIGEEVRPFQPDFKTETKARDSPDWLQRAGDATENFAADLLMGFVKGGASTAINLGDLAQHTPLLGRVLQAVNTKLFDLTPEQQHAAFDAARTAVAPTNLTQSVGKGVEQIAEVAVPSKAIAAAGTKAATMAVPRLTQSLGPLLARALPRVAVESAGAAGLSAAQGGDPLTGAVLGAAVPVAGEAISALPAGLKAAAEKKVVQALGPTKERFKAIANRLAPEMLRRGLSGSRASLQQKAADTLETVGDQLDAALTQYGPQRVPTQAVHDALETAKDAFRTTRDMPIQQAIAQGLANKATAIQNGIATIPVEFEPRAIRQLSGLQKIVSDLGPDATVEQLTAVRRAWDKVVSQAGGYAQRAGGAIGVPLKDQSEAFAKREGAGAIRKLLADEVPDLAAINKEYSFWKNLDDVLTQTIQRTQGQGPGLIAKTAEAGGQVVGAVSGGIGTAIGLGKMAKWANYAFTSPRWRMVDAKLRNSLADAIMSGNSSQIASTLGRITAVQASKLPAAVSSR